MAVRWATRPDQETLAGTLATLPEHDRRARHEAAGDHRRRRSGAAAREAELVRAAAAVRQAHRGDARPRAGRCWSRSGCDALGADAVRAAHHRDRGPRPTTARSTAPSPGSPSYDWLIFTSANGVRFFLERLDRSGGDLRALRAKICAIGPATRAAVEALHLKVDLMGKEYVAEGLLEAFAPYDLCRQARPAAARRGGARPGPRRTRAARRARWTWWKPIARSRPRMPRRGSARCFGAKPDCDHLHQFLDGPELRGGGGRGDPAGSGGGVHRTGDDRYRPGTGHRSHRAGERVYDGRAARSGARGVRQLTVAPVKRFWV